MNELNQNSYNPMFQHIYIEKRAYDYELTKKILTHFSMSNHELIEIDHYKDVFNRSNQSFHHEKQSPSLILAVKEGRNVYEGAPVCQSFGQEHFYYTSCMMNCIYDCEYCYLQGMYPSGNIVVFVNLKDIFSSVESLLEKHPVYLCISYDTDLLAIEPFLGIVHDWISFTEKNPGLTVELRTKSANLKSILDTKPNPRFILAWTVSPSDYARKYEHRTPSLDLRIDNVKTALQLGYPVRLCFDPMLAMRGWKEAYSTLLDTITSSIDLHLVKDISLGIFRISADYMSILRKQRPTSVIVQYPYENDHGVFHINTEQANEMIQWMKDKLSAYVTEDQLFIWKEVEEL